MPRSRPVASTSTIWKSGSDCNHLPWLKLKFRVANDEAERVAEALEEGAAEAVSLEDAGDQPLFDEPDRAEEGSSPSYWRETWVGALLPIDADTDAVVQSVALALGRDPTCVREWIADQDWERAWLDQFKPLPFGGGLWICPSWCTPPERDATNVILDPGLAFGTGTHATTRLCLEWLAGHPTQGDVIDYGCGSGILAISALNLGARRAFGVDIDPRALEVSRENARRNGVEAKCAFLLPEALASGIVGDMVFANILAGPLVRLAPTLTALTAPHGTLLLSGLLTQQRDEVHAAYEQEFTVEPRTLDGWALLVCRRK